MADLVDERLDDWATPGSSLRRGSPTGPPRPPGSTSADRPGDLGTPTPIPGPCSRRSVRIERALCSLWAAATRRVPSGRSPDPGGPGSRAGRQSRSSRGPPTPSLHATTVAPPHARRTGTGSPPRRPPCPPSRRAAPRRSPRPRRRRPRARATRPRAGGETVRDPGALAGLVRVQQQHPAHRFGEPAVGPAVGSSGSSTPATVHPIAERRTGWPDSMDRVRPVLGRVLQRPDRGLPAAARRGAGVLQRAVRVLRAVPLRRRRRRAPRLGGRSRARTASTCSTLVEPTRSSIRASAASS